MPVQNPNLTRIQPQTARAPLDTSYVTTRALGSLAQTGLEVAEEAIMESFRSDINDAVTTAKLDVAAYESGVAADIDAQYGKEPSISRSIALLQAAANQGVMTETQVMLEAEKAVRDAMAKRPAMAAQFQREATLLLGSNPVGTALQAASVSNKTAAAAAQRRLDDILDHAYGPLASGGLGISPAILPSDPMFQLEYTRRQARQDAMFYAAEAVTLHGQQETLNQNAVLDLVRQQSVGFYDVVSQNVKGFVDQWSRVTPDERMAWINGRVAIGGKTRQEFLAEQETTKLALRELLTQPGVTGAIRPQLTDMINGMINSLDTIAGAMSDPNVDTTVINSLLEHEASSFWINQPQSDRYAIEYMTKVSQFINAVNSGPTPLIRVQQFPFWGTMMGLMTGSITGTPIANNPSAQELNRATSTYVQNATQVANARFGSTKDPLQHVVNEDLQGIRDTLALFNDPEIAQSGISDGAGGSLYAVLNTVTNLKNPTSDIVENTVGALAQPGVIPMLANADPTIRFQVVEQANSFYKDQYARYMDEVSDFMETQTISGVTGNLGEQQKSIRMPIKRAIRVDVDDIRDNGTIRFTYDAPPNVDIFWAERVGLQRDLDRYSRIMSDGIRAQAHLEAARTGTAPNYLEIYDIVRGGGVVPGNYSLPFSHNLPPVE